MTPEQQRKTALEIGNTRRIQACARRKHIGSLPLDDAIEEVVSILANPDEACGSLRTERLLTAIHGFGPKKVAYIAAMATGFDSARRGRKVRELSHRERIILAASLKRWNLTRARRRVAA